MDYIASLSEPGISALLLAFGLGIGTSFTPCVYPLIPITLALFGAGEDTPRGRAFLLACTYVLGMSTTYTGLGLFVASTGGVFGAFLGSTPVILVVAVLLTLMAAFTLDVFHIPVLHRLQSRANAVGGKGLLGAYLMGLLSGVVAAPCVGPVLVAILAIAASSGDTLWGGALLLTYSLGLGLIFIALGTFSGLLSRIPRSGNWMYGVKFALASALLFLTLYFLQPLLPNPLIPVDSRGMLIGIQILFIASALIGAFLAIRNDHRPLKFAAALLFAIGAYEIVIADHGTPSSTIVWHASLDTALEEAKRENRPIFIDLSADWCAACKELDKLTFPHPAVQKLLKNFVTVKLDFTVPDPEITERLSVVGLPLLVFLDPNGDEIPDSRMQRFVPAEEFLEHAKKVLNH